MALGQRATMILVAVGCLLFYVLQRGDLREVIHELEEADAEADMSLATEAQRELRPRRRRFVLPATDWRSS